MESHGNHFSLDAFDLHMVTWLEEATSCGDQDLVRRMLGAGGVETDSLETAETQCFRGKVDLSTK